MEDVTMRRFVICLAVCFILFSAVPAQAGRTVHGDAASPYCDCGRQDGVPCYDENTNQRCDGWLLTSQEEPARKKSKSVALPYGKGRDVDAGSLGLFVLVTALLLRRFIY
jgi:hypothetical protein